MNHPTFTNSQIFFQHLATFQVALLIGMTLVIVEQYLPHAFDRLLRKRHVLLMGYSYVVLLLITLGGVYAGYFFDPAPLHEMRSYALISVYLASDFGMYYLFEYVHHMKHEQHEQTRTEATTAD